MNQLFRRFAGLVTILAASGFVWAQAKPQPEKPSDEERLQQLLKRFPDADANKDGVLTRAEAAAYQALRKNAAAKTDGAKQGRPTGPAIPPTHPDVKYGPAERNVLDFYQAKSDKPTPLIIYIHGGGFVGGDKRSINGAILRGALDSGISCAAIHYRFVNGQDVIFPAPQHDGARALQFLRSKAKEWNIDPNRVACFGGSAGAGISMWLGFHEDLADPNSDDPVKRQSTRIQAIGTFGGQSTYDPIEIKKLIGGRAWEHPSIFKVYGVKSAEEALHPTPAQKKLYDECAAITHLTKDDPPLYMVYNEADGPLPADARPGQGIHHPNFGRQLKEKMDELNIENVFVYTPSEKGRDVNAEMLAFFIKQFAKVK
jgi:acetyl esterase/lipase